MRATLLLFATLFLAAEASAQDLFVSAGSSSNAKIFQYTPKGERSLFASGESYPEGVTFDSAGNLFVANTDNNGGNGNITRITPEGAQTVLVSGIDPQDLAFNSAGDLFECEYRSGDICEFKNDNGTLSSNPIIFTTGFANPLCVAFNSSGDLFVGAGYGPGNGYVAEVTPSGVQSTIATGLTFPSGLVFDSAGNLYVTQLSTGIITKITPAGVQSTFATLPEVDVSKVTFDHNGDLFVGGGNSGDIIEITPGGMQRVFASGLHVVEGVAFEPTSKPMILVFRR